MDRIVDRLARALHLDPAALRRRNFIQPEEMPYDTGQLYRGQPLIYDTGNFPEALDQALTAIGYDAFRAEQEALRARGPIAVSALPVTSKAPVVGPTRAPPSRWMRLAVSWWSPAPARRGKDTPRRSRNWRPTRSVCPRPGDGAQR